VTAILVTGAAGFVGRALCRELQLRGHDVRGATRTSPGDLQISTVAVGNIGPDTDWSAAVTGCDAIVHLAAHVHVMRDEADDPVGEFNRVNVQGSENLARQAARAGVRRFLFLSSVKVNGEVSAGRAFVESDPARPMDAYGRSKAEAERRLKGVSAETGMEIVIVRPPLVYGPGIKANFLKLLRVVDAGMPLPFASIANRRSLVYVDNLVHALRICVAHPAAANRTFFVSDDFDVSTPQLVREIATALGKRPRLYPFPPLLLRGFGLLTGSGEQIGRLTGSLQVDISSIKSALGWRPPFTLQKGFAETASWYRSLRT
jgi:nucleoside-diphosphate-sugar epimerase